MVSTQRAFIVVATCIYLRRMAAAGKKTSPSTPCTVLEVEEDIDTSYTGENATLMEWVDLRGTDEAMPKCTSGDAPEALATAVPFPKDSILLRNAAVCSIIPSDESAEENVPTYADLAKSIMDTFWRTAELQDLDDTNSDIGVDEEGGWGAEDWDAWTGVMRLRTPAPTPTSAIMTLPTLVTPPLSAYTESRYRAASAFRSMTSTLGTVFNWTCGVAYHRGPDFSSDHAQLSEEYPLRTMKKKAPSGPSYTQVEDDGDGDIPSMAASQLKRPAIAVAARMIGVNPPRRTAGWMRVDADDIV